MMHNALETYMLCMLSYFNALGWKAWRERVQHMGGHAQDLFFSFFSSDMFVFPALVKKSPGSRRDPAANPGGNWDLAKIPPMRQYPAGIPTGKNFRHAGIPRRILAGRPPAGILPRRQTFLPGSRQGKILATFPGKNLAGNFILAGIPSRKNYWRKTLRE